MFFHTFGNPNNPKIILIHGVLTPWQVWAPQIDWFKNKYYVIAPALNGHIAEEKSEFISTDCEAEMIEKYCINTYCTELYAVCGLSMGGTIAFKLWRNGKLKIQNLVLDGAPLVPYNSLLKNIMIYQYLDIVRKSRKRNVKTLENFKKVFLPEKYLNDYLDFIDNMSDKSVINIVTSSCGDLKYNMPEQQKTNLLYIHGTKMNEMLSKKTAKLMLKYYPKTKIIRYKGYSHCYGVSI